MLLNTLNRRYYSLEGIGIYIWDLIGKKSRTTPELLKAIVSHFDVSQSEAENDLEAFLDSMSEVGFIQVSKE